MAPCGAISVLSSIGVMTAPASVPAEVPMFAELGARPHGMMMGTALDHDGLSICNRWRRDSNRAKGGKNVSKLLHVRSSIEWGLNMEFRRTFQRNYGTILNGYSA